MAIDSRKPIINIKSRLLSEDDHTHLFNLFNQRCMTLSTSVVQLVIAPGPHYNKWVKESCGVITFIKDNPKRSYFIRIYDIKGRKMLFEQELYNNFKFTALTPKFYYFDGKDHPVGINFSDEREARAFSSAVNEKLMAKHKRRNTLEEKKITKFAAPGIPDTSNLASTNNNNNGIKSVLTKPINRNLNESKSKSKKSKKKNRISKTEIGLPTNFVQLQHFGIDSMHDDNDSDTIDPQEMQLIEKYWPIIEKVGISREQIKKESIIRKFVMNFIEENKDKYNEEDRGQSENRTAPVVGPPPRVPSPNISRPQRTRQAPPKISAQTNPTTVTPPSTQTTVHAAPILPKVFKPPQRPGMTAPPPPPPSRPIGSIKNAAAPPPPPPPPSANVPMPPPPSSTPMVLPNKLPTKSAPVQSDDRSDLLVAIRSASKGGLKKVVEQKRISASGDDRSCLMNSIRGGIQLKQASQIESNRESQLEEEGGLAGALARALAKRGNAMADSDSDSSTVDSDEDEWSD